MKAHDFAEYIMSKVPSSIIETLTDEQVDKLWEDFNSNQSAVISNTEYPNKCSNDARFAEVLEREGKIEEYVLIDPSKPEGERYSIYNVNPYKAPKGTKICHRYHEFTGEEKFVNYIVPVIENGTIIRSESHPLFPGNEIPAGAILYTKSFVNEYKKCSKKLIKGKKRPCGQRYIDEYGNVPYESQCVERGIDCTKLIQYSQKYHGHLTKEEKAALYKNLRTQQQYELF